MKKFKNTKTGNIVRVTDPTTAKLMAASAQYEEVVDKKAAKKGTKQDEDQKQDET